MSRPRRVGPKLCSRCGAEVSAWRSYCPTCQKEYDRKKAARELAAACEEGNVDRADNDITTHRRAVLWQYGPNGESMIIGALDAVGPAPTGKAIAGAGW